MQTAPIALFAYNRLQHLRLTVEALQKNELASQSDLFFYSDASKGDSDRNGVEEVRHYLRTVSGFRRVNIVERETNFGLARSIISGVTELVNSFDRVIVLEDDMVTSPHFLRYMNEALDLYEHEERVASIHGYLYPLAKRLSDTFFLKGADCWGWATWRRGWALFEPDGRKLLTALHERGLEKRFDYQGAYPYMKMLKDQISGKNDSWAIRWYASALLENKLTLYPGRSLVRNIGTDDSGTHCADTSVYETDTAAVPVRVGGIAVAEDLGALEEFERYFRSIRPSLFRKILQRLKSRRIKMDSWHQYDQ